ncbi:MAG: mannose-1-phosphate guanylyltransferase [Ignavibacteria bacterium RBG_13_36_8]|nr:MAG: mannose-1-phosphate guanylyltransferase [Ignavibacteria bacterium RBG_13_36_8]
MELFAVVMAGGIGSRFWPRSKQKKPKQLIRIFGENTMIQDTISRLDKLISNDHIYIVTSKIQKQRVIDQLPEIPAENIIAEPYGKNTAACIGLASVIIQKKCKDAVTIVLAADHLIRDIKNFQSSLKLAAEFALNSKGLVTIGIPPTRPETGYGYIQFDEKNVAEKIHKVITFAEKPNLSTAKRFMEAGDFLWNSGMFIWRTDAILSEIQEHMPDLHDGLLEIQKSLDKPEFESVLINVYGQLKSISIDYGVMEKSKNVFLIKGNFDWSDVGNWETVYELSSKDEEGNVKIGDVYVEESFNSYIFAPQKFAAVIGVSDLIVINTKDALLICHRGNAQDVKQVVDYLKMKNKDELL